MDWIGCGSGWSTVMSMIFGRGTVDHGIGPSTLGWLEEPNCEHGICQKRKSIGAAKSGAE